MWRFFTKTKKLENKGDWVRQWVVDIANDLDITLSKQELHQIMMKVDYHTHLDDIKSEVIRMKEVGIVEY